jgi:hypothetical protein
MVAFLDPEPAAAVLVGEGYAPVVAVLRAFAKIFSGAAVGSEGDDDCPSPGALLLEPSTALLVGERHAPVVAVLEPAECRQASPFLPPKGADHCP